MMPLMAHVEPLFPPTFCMSAHDVHLGRRPLHIGIDAVHKELVRGVIQQQLSRLRYLAANGMVCNQTPACGAINARSLAWPNGSPHPFHTIATSWAISGLSQSLCCSGIGSITVGSESLGDYDISSLYVSIHSSASRMVSTSG